MPVPAVSMNHRVVALENDLARAVADKAAKDGFIAQLVETIEAQDLQIDGLSKGEQKVTKASK